LGLAETGFIHAVCKTHVGKTEGDKQQLSTAVLHALENHAKTFAKQTMVITVEVIEMDKASYAKSLVNPR